MQQRAHDLTPRIYRAFAPALILLIVSLSLFYTATSITRPAALQGLLASVRQAAAAFPRLDAELVRSTEERLQQQIAQYPYHLAGVLLMALLAFSLGIWRSLRALTVVWTQRRYRRLAAGLCGRCRYPLEGLESLRCPECGDANAWADAAIPLPPD